MSNFHNVRDFKKKQVLRNLDQSPISDENVQSLYTSFETAMQNAMNKGDQEGAQNAFFLMMLAAEVKDSRALLKNIKRPIGLKTDLLPAIKFLSQAFPHIGLPVNAINPILHTPDGKSHDLKILAPQKCFHCDLLRAIAAAGIELEAIQEAPEYLQEAFVKPN